MDEKEKVYQLQQEIEAQVNTLWLYFINECAFLKLF